MLSSSEICKWLSPVISGFVEQMTYWRRVIYATVTYCKVK